jgi:hypothetical protein
MIVVEKIGGAGGAHAVESRLAFGAAGKGVQHSPAPLPPLLEAGGEIKLFIAS